VDAFAAIRAPIAQRRKRSAPRRSWVGIVAWVFEAESFRHIIGKSREFVEFFARD